MSPDRFEEQLLPSLFWPIPIFDALRETAKERVKEGNSSSAERVGFQLLLAVMTDGYAVDFDRWHLAGIEGDRLSNRAFFRGVELEEWPTTSPQGRMWKRLRSLVLRVERADDWPSVLSGLDQIHREFVIPARRLLRARFRPLTQIGDSDTIVRWIATIRLANSAYHTSTVGFSRLRIQAEQRLQKRPTASSTARLLHGYIATIAKVWRFIIPDERLCEEAVAQLQTFHSWEDLNKLPNLLWVRGTAILNEDKLLRQTTSISSRDFPSLTKLRPEHETTQMRLDRALMWYETATLGTHGETAATGAAMLVSLIRGEAAVRRDHNVREALQVIRFRHPPTEAETITWFSYAVLIERSGISTDGSQWLISLQVGGDYSGSGGLDYEAVEAALEREGSGIQVVEIEVPYVTLLEHLKKEDMVFTSLAGIDDILADRPDRKAELGRMLASFERFVIVLGNYRKSKGLLDAIAMALRASGYEAFLVSDLPDVEDRTVDQKAQTLMNLARFCIMLDDYPSGHIAEYFLARGNLAILARLVPPSGGSTRMLGGDELAGARHARSFTYRRSPLDVLEKAVEWAERERDQKIKRIKAATSRVK